MLRPSASSHIITYCRAGAGPPTSRQHEPTNQMLPQTEQYLHEWARQRSMRIGKLEGDVLAQKPPNVAYKRRPGDSQYSPGAQLRPRRRLADTTTKNQAGEVTNSQTKDAQHNDNATRLASRAQSTHGRMNVRGGETPNLGGIPPAHRLAGPNGRQHNAPTPSILKATD